MAVIQKSTFKKLRRKKKAPAPELPLPPIEELDTVLANMRRIKARGKADAEQYFALEVQAMHLMRTNGRDTYDGRTLVESEVAELNVEKFKTLIMPKQWDLITRRVLDNDLLSAAVSRGHIDPQIVKKCTTMKPRKPYIRGN